MQKGSWKYSVVKGKCPRCNGGDLWVNKKSYSSGFSEMHERCSSCDLKYDIEQGFWYGAMYISYALGVAVVVSIVILLSIIGEYGVLVKSGIATLFLIFLMPLIFRYSRTIWLNIFVHFDSKYLPSEN